MCWVCQAPCLIVPEGQLPSVSRIVKFENILKVTQAAYGDWDVSQFSLDRPLANGEEIAE